MRPLPARAAGTPGADSSHVPGGRYRISLARRIASIVSTTSVASACDTNDWPPDQVRAYPVALRVTILRNYWGVVPIEVFFCPLGDPDKEAPWPIPILLFCVREDVRRRLERKEERLSP
jgi:hypothetical protein